MTTYEKAILIIAETLPKCRGEAVLDAADRILRALQAERIVPTTMRGSPEMLKRWHSHCRFLGTQTGDGYEYFYNLAIAHAVEMDMWPVKLIEKTISIDGHEITVDIQVPQSTTRATNKQLMCAYEVIVDAAAEHKVALPENVEEMYT